MSLASLRSLVSGPVRETYFPSAIHCPLALPPSLNGLVVWESSSHARDLEGSVLACLNMVVTEALACQLPIYVLS